LSWQIQGTVADILNAACLKIIELETSKHWKLCFPEHDAVYVIGTPEQAAEIGQIMEAEAARLNLPLTVKVETFGAGDVVCK
jgi:DNA polymerase I-like protein with 3'-5' exonuclease and polymerase domains